MRLIDYVFYKICQAYKYFDESDPEIYAIGAIPLLSFVNFYILKLVIEKSTLYVIELSSFSIITFFILSFLLLSIKHYALDKGIKKVETIKAVVGITQYLGITCLTLMFFISMNFLFN